MRGPEIRRKALVTSGSRRRFGYVLLLAILLAPLCLQAQIVSPEVRKVSERFVCQCGCNQQLSVCSMLNCGSATPLRAEIAELLKQGKTEEQIAGIFVAKYGRSILAAPTTQGFDLTAWILPVIMLLFGLGLVYGLIRVWAKRKKPRVEGTQDSGTIPDAYQEQIERELRDLDS